MTDREFQPVAVLDCDPGSAQVYEFGWQSWSPAALYRAGSRSARPQDPTTQVMNYRPGCPAPGEGFQGEGLLAVARGGDEPILIFAAEGPDLVPSIRARLLEDRLEVSADGQVRIWPGERGAGVDESLGSWAESFPGAGRATRKSLPPVWCSWYCLGDRVTAAAVIRAARSARQRQLPISVFQVDDGWQAATGDWWPDRERFGDLRELARALSADGLELGVWVAPFVAAEDSEAARRHPDWYRTDLDAGRNWKGRILALDLRREAALAHLSGRLQGLAELGVSYFKLDFLYAGALEGPGSGIGPYRMAMASIRRAIGSGARLVACGAPLLPTVGLADAVRVGPDTAPGWEPPSGDLSQPSGRSAQVVSRARAFTNGRWWTNDPDCLLARPGVERRGVRARQLSELAGLATSGDLPDDLDRWGLARTRRLMRPSATGPSAPPGPMPVTRA